MKLKNRRAHILHRILKRVEIDTKTGCWLWQGRTSGTGRGGGYGRIDMGGTTMAVHRVVYTNFYGIIPHKKQVDHTCYNRRCCNPEHLELVTHKENQRRKLKC